MPSQVQPIMGPKRASIDDVHQASKFPKTEHDGTASPLTQQRPQNNDFSGSVKKKLASSTRTGQACDRCKIRKIRCDGRPEGCSPCAQNRTLCKTTDRITGRATTRGHTEATEAENNYLRAQIAELQAQLKELGVEPRTVSGYSEFSPTSLPWQQQPVGLASSTPGWEDASQRRTSDSSLPGYTPATGLDDSDYRPLPQFKHGSVGDNYLGVSSGDTLLSNIKGTSLSVFGTEIDITDFVQSGSDYDKSVVSYTHFLKVILNEDADVQYVTFGDYQRLHEYATWYLRSMNPYTMLLDRPTVMNLIWRIGNEPTFSPSPAEIVCVHMMLASLKYQISVRNGEASMMEEAHKHYRYSLSFFKQLLHGHTWQDVQALAMMCHHMRNFPKPGAAWIMVSTTFLLAVELGLHRSTKAWADSREMDKLEVEMRKRVFWTLHALATNLSGKLGRPMPITMDDVDVEFPEPMNDCLPGEDTGLTPFHKCSFQVGIQTAKYTVWSSELYRSVYAVRQTPRGYEDAVKRLEGGIRRWRAETPPELFEPARASQEDYIFALYLEYWDLEFQLLLHHPAACRSTNPAIVNANLDKCLAASQKMLHNCNEMRKSKSLDIPWVNTVVYIAAIFTTLFIHFQRKDQLYMDDMTKLQNDMSQWTDVMGECGQLLGTGDQLKNAVSKIIENSLSSINESIVKRNTESLARAALQAPHGQAPQPIYGNGSAYDQYSDPNASSTDAALATSSTTYPGSSASAPFSYNNGPSAPVVPQHQQTSNAFTRTVYSASEDAGMPPSHAAALAAAASGAPPQHTNGTYAYANAPNATNGYQAPYQANGVSTSDWHHWSRTNLQQQLGPPGEYINSANTLLALGGREGGSQGPGPETATAVEGTAMQGPGFSNYPWPRILFNAGPNEHVA